MKKENISKLLDCYGCSVCTSVCPVNIIEIKESRDGFYLPTVTDNDKCIECGLCLKSCSFNSNIEFENKITTYASWSNDKVVRYKASSGGVAYELACKALELGYKYCGVRYDYTKCRAVHYICSTKEELKESFGSKYIPSYAEDAFKELLSKTNKSEKYIVFGTPCQIASLRLAIKRINREDNFILVDFFCHGVPSLKVWDKYLEERPLIKNMTFTWRDKKNGWHDSWYIIGSDENGKEVYRSPKVSNDTFYAFFLGHLALSPCCLESCKYKKYNSIADIRLGDLWGEKYKCDEDGVSGILCFTNRGLSLVETTEKLHLISESPEIVVEGQMSKNASKPKAYLLARQMLRHTNLKLATIVRISGLYNKIVLLPHRIISKLKTLNSKK